MEVTSAQKTTPPVKLSSVKPGDVIHFANTPQPVALAEKAIYVVVGGPTKEGMVSLVNLSDGQPLMRDNTHLVYVLPCELVIHS